MASLSYLLTLFIILFPFDSGGKIVSENNEYILKLTSIIELKDNLMITSDDVGSFTFNDTFILHATQNPVSVLAYDITTGSQLHVFGNKGRGPFEYMFPISVFLDENVYVLCRSNGLKIFLTDGSQLDEHSVIKPSANTHAVSSNNVAIQSGFKPEKRLIDIYDIEVQKIIYQKGFATDNDIWLSPMTHAGGLFFKENILFYSLPDRLEINVFDLAKDRETTYSYTNNRYKRSDLLATVDEVNQDPMIMIDYLMNRSIVSNLYAIGNDSYMLELDHRSLDEENYSELMIINADMEWIDSIILPPAFLKEYGEFSRAAFGNKILYYNEHSDEKGEIYKKAYIFEIIKNESD